MVEEIPELGERTGRQRLPAVHHQTLATSSSQHKTLTKTEQKEGVGCDGDQGQQFSLPGHANGMG
eukprot:9488547-Ditylum_brightwellii.AAC.1